MSTTNLTFDSIFVRSLISVLCLQNFNKLTAEVVVKLDDALIERMSESVPDSAKVSQGGVGEVKRKKKRRQHGPKQK